jgi:engulfment and cell motility protein 1
MEDLQSCILDFQANMLRVTHRKKTMMIDSQNDPNHAAILNQIWVDSKLEEERQENGESFKWRKLGFETEDIDAEFADVGILGLECFVRGAVKYLAD